MSASVQLSLLRSISTASTFRQYSTVAQTPCSRPRQQQRCRISAGNCRYKTVLVLQRLKAQSTSQSQAFSSARNSLIRRPLKSKILCTAGGVEEAAFANESAGSDLIAVVAEAEESAEEPSSLDLVSITDGVKDADELSYVQLSALGVLQRYWEVLRSQGLMLLWCFMATFVSVLTFSLSYPIVGQQVDILSAVGPGAPLNRPLFFRSILISALVYIAQGLGTYAQVTISAMLGERFSLRLRERLFSALLAQDLAFHDQPGSSVGELVNWLGSDVNVMQSSVVQLVGARGVRALMELISIGAIMLYLSPRLAAVVALTVPFLAQFTRIVMSKNVDLGRKSQEATSNAASVANEVLFSMDTVRVFGAEEREVKRFSQKVDTAYSFSAKMARLAGLQDGVVRLVAQASSILALAYGSWLATKGQASPGVTYTFLSYTFNLSTALQSLASAAGEVGRSTGSAERVFGLLEHVKPPSSAWPPLQKPSKVGGDVELQGVWFRYPSAQPNQWALRGASFRARKGSVTALVGPSGSGKSTIAALLLRLYEPTGGHLMLDGNALTTLEPHWLRSQIGVVSQDVALFTGTVSENIAYAKPGASQAQVEAAAAAANAHHFIQNLPEGYQTQVGERGELLSGGQRQRLAIARALLKDPKLLILDEATSALDVESEALVSSALKRLMTGRTTLLIAHRLSTVRDADHIVVLEGGRVREEGNHESLGQKKDGLYRQMLRLSEGRTDPIEHLFDLADELDFLSQATEA